MKLWKVKKPISCVPGKSSLSKNEDRSDSIGLQPTNSAAAGDRAMSPAQSEDSGLAPDRGTTYATISLPRENAQAMGIVFAERPDLSYPPLIASLNALGPAADFLAPGDRIHQIDGISTVGLTNQHIMSLLCHGEGPAVVEIEYSLPEYISQNSLCVTSKLAQITVERENGCLGLTLRGGGDFPLIVTHVRPHGPVFQTGRIKPGDRLLRVDNISLISKTLSEAQLILKCGHVSGYTNLMIEYDVSVMQSVEFSMGPLLIEIERPLSEKLGLILSNYSPILHNDHTKIDEVSTAGVYVASILPASIADRCGALSVGDQILSVDETVIENAVFNPEDVMALLDTNTGRGYTQIQIMPAHTLARRGLPLGSPKYGFSTLESRRTRQRKMVRKSSLPLETGTLHPNLGICRTETAQITLDCSHGSGIILGAQTICGRGVTIAQIMPDSAGERCGCIQKGDRIIAVNKMYNLDGNAIRQLLGDETPRIFQTANWVELEIEFDMADSVVPSSGVFNVKLAKFGKAGLGITVNGSSHGAFLITEVKQGSPAHRIGSLRAGDILLAVDSHPLQHFNVDALLKDNKNDFTVLTIKRNALPDFLFDAQQRMNPIYGNCPNNDSEIYGYTSRYGDCTTFKSATPQPEYFRLDEIKHSTLRRPYLNKSCERSTIGRTVGAENTQSLTTEVADESYNDLSPYEIDYPSNRFMTIDSSEFPPPMENKTYINPQYITTIRLEPNGGPLGITLSGSEDMQKPILISGVIEGYLNERRLATLDLTETTVTAGGVAHNSGQIRVGDRLLAINGESVQGMPLSHATKLLQNLDNVVDLKIVRSASESDSPNMTDSQNNLPQPQAVYAKVQRRPRSPSFTDVQSNSSKDSKHRALQVTLYKDKVYDDFGFSVSDGLYEKGVYINRIRTGGPADLVGVLKPFDRIMQVNGTRTQDFDCCLTVPLIAASGDKMELILQRTIAE